MLVEFGPRHAVGTGPAVIVEILTNLDVQMVGSPEIRALQLSLGEKPPKDGIVIDPISPFDLDILDVDVDRI